MWFKSLLRFAYRRVNNNRPAPCWLACAAVISYDTRSLPLVQFENRILRGVDVVAALPTAVELSAEATAADLSATAAATGGGGGVGCGGCGVVGNSICVVLAEVFDWFDMCYNYVFFLYFCTWQILL